MLSPETEKLIKAFKKSNLSKEDRTALMTALLSGIGAFPIGDIILRTEKGLMVDGKLMDLESTLAFYEACAGLKDNFARKFISEQLRHKAIQMGIDKATSLDELIFSKAVLWIINEENILIHTLAQN